MAKASAGWVRQALQLPKDIADLFRKAVADRPEGGVKIRGAAAIYVYLSLPDEIRIQIDELVLTRTWNGFELPPWEVWATIADILRAQPELMTERPGKLGSYDMSDLEDKPKDTHSVSRILDPHVTLPPGQKPADRAKKTKGA